MRPAEFGAPFDALWFHLPKPEQDPPSTLAYLTKNGMVLTLDRDEYYESGMVIPKGRFDSLRQAGLAAVQARSEAPVRKCSACSESAIGVSRAPQRQRAGASCHDYSW